MVALKELEEFGVGEIVDVQVELVGSLAYVINLVDSNGTKYSSHIYRGGGLSYLAKEEADGSWTLVYDAFDTGRDDCSASSTRSGTVGITTTAKPGTISCKAATTAPSGAGSSTPTAPSWPARIC